MNTAKYKLSWNRLTLLVGEYSLTAAGANAHPRIDRLTLTDNELLESFYLHRRAGGRSHRTLKFYADNLYFLVQYSIRAGKQLCTITRADLTRFIIDCVDSGLSPASVNCRIRAIRAFYNYCTDNVLHGDDPLLHDNPAAGLKEMKLDHFERHTLTPEEVSTILRHVKSRSFCTARNRCIMYILYDTGMRSAEICGLTLRDVDLHNGVLHVNSGKSRRSRQAPISQKTVLCIHTYLKRWRKVPGDWLLPFSNGDQFTPDRMHRIFYDLGDKLGINLSPKVWRHTFATEFLAHGGGLTICQRLMGHKSIRSTMEYAHIADEQTTEQHHKHSPMARLKE